MSNCNKFVEAVSGDYCSIFASNNGITTAQLYAWNPVLGSAGQNCGSAFFAGYDYCVRGFLIFSPFDEHAAADMYTLGRHCFINYVNIDHIDIIYNIQHTNTIRHCFQLQQIC